MKYTFLVWTYCISHKNFKEYQPERLGRAQPHVPKCKHCVAGRWPPPRASQRDFPMKHWDHTKSRDLYIYMDRYHQKLGFNQHLGVWRARESTKPQHLGFSHPMGLWFPTMRMDRTNHVRNIRKRGMPGWRTMKRWPPGGPWPLPEVCQVEVSPTLLAAPEEFPEWTCFDVAGMLGWWLY